MKINLPCVGLSCFVYFDFDKFSKAYELTEGEIADLFDSQGCQTGNGIYINLEAEAPIKTSVHEISHYLDWAFEDVFNSKGNREVTEIRARMHEYLFEKITDRIIKLTQS